MTIFKIYNVQSIKLFALGFAVVGILFGQLNTSIGIGFILIGCITLVCASAASRCPHCDEYLTYKSVWVGKHCKHCGIKIEDLREGPPDENA